MVMKCLERYLIICLKVILLAVITQSAYGLTDKDLIPVIKQYDLPIQSDYSDNVNHDLQPFEDPTSTLMGYKSKSGEVVIKPQFDKALAFSEFGIADVFLKPDKWYKIDKTGKKLYQSYFFDNGPDYYVAGLMRFIKNNKIGFANRHGKIVIPASFEFAMPFSYSAPVTIVCKGCQRKISPNDSCQHADIRGGKWGMINSKGEIIVPIEFDSYDVFENGAVVFLKNDYVFRVYVKKE